jgi:hypothetical protein
LKLVENWSLICRKLIKNEECKLKVGQKLFECDQKFPKIGQIQLGWKSVENGEELVKC